MPGRNPFGRRRRRRRLSPLKQLLTLIIGLGLMLLAAMGKAFIWAN